MHEEDGWEHAETYERQSRHQYADDDTSSMPYVAWIFTDILNDHKKRILMQKVRQLAIRMKISVYQNLPRLGKCAYKLLARRKTSFVQLAYSDR